MRSSFARRLAAGVLLLGLVTPALADPQGLAVTLYDEHGKPLGTSAFPLVVTGGTGGGGGSGGAITGPLGPSTTAANSVATTFGAGTTLPAFAAPPSVLVGVYNATLPTLTSGSAAQASLDVNGKVLIQGGNSAPVSVSGTVAATQSGTWTAAVTNAGTFAVQNTASTPAGSAIMGKVGIDQTTPGTTNGVVVNSGTVAATEASGANVALGSTTDAPLTGAASTTAATLQAETKGLYNQFQAGTAKLQGALWYTEASAASIAASGNGAGTLRSTGGSSGSGQPYPYFQATVTSTQTGTLTTACGNFFTSANVAANVPTVIKVPAFGTGCAATYANGTTASTYSLADGFTLN